jgi:hypothetical protein
MAPKRTCKLVQEAMVEKPTQDLDVPSEAIREEEQKDYEEQEDHENHNDHENEEE